MGPRAISFPRFAAQHRTLATCCSVGASSRGRPGAGPRGEGGGRTSRPRPGRARARGRRARAARMATPCLPCTTVCTQYTPHMYTEASHTHTHTHTPPPRACGRASRRSLANLRGLVCLLDSGQAPCPQLSHLP
ncbi:hypothetical protein K505DRAFT_83639 [Melanomma pulvis-pyrius CBS 109.77]|uniref:Uncharacterized protein n=1 Tax=Melanomma pulvis-pyrius CBS 109.77 TaxID=1314802 RepID=A0A6A6X1X9_9PLEO|nr:hypothetical protein K505DRAFT_83639 [Melanomma pulvis-pyrius CBS 109.77]